MPCEVFRKLKAGLTSEEGGGLQPTADRSCKFPRILKKVGKEEESFWRRKCTFPVCNDRFAYLTLALCCWGDDVLAREDCLCMYDGLEEARGTQLKQN